MILNQMVQLGLLKPPKFLESNVQWLVMAGSHAYGCYTAESDKDYVGYCMPMKEQLFPYSFGGKIYGYDDVQNFDQYKDKSKPHKDFVESDWDIYNIVKIFRLMRDNNPNCIEMLYVPRECVLHSTKIGEMVREKRNIFLSKKIFFTHRGYSFQMQAKAKNKNPEPDSKRAKLRELYGVDVKYLYNAYRLLSQCEQYFTDGEVDLQRDKEVYKSIRRGEWSMERMDKWIESKEQYLNKLYEESTVLPHKPDDVAIKQLLLDCIEEWYGDVSSLVRIDKEDKSSAAIRQIKEIVGEL